MKYKISPTIGTLSPESCGCFAITGQLSSPVSTTNWFQANAGVFVPFTVVRPTIVTRIYVDNGNTVSGNIDVGIYTLRGARIVSNGSTAHVNVSNFQFFDIADTPLSPGTYYMAIALSAVAGRVRQSTVSGRYFAHVGCYQASSVFPLPAFVTFATNTALFIPSMGLEIRPIL